MRGTFPSQAETVASDDSSILAAGRWLGVRSLALRYAGSAALILATWGTATRLLILLSEGVPDRSRWVHFALGTGYEIMSGCVAALVVYPVSAGLPRVGRWSAFALALFVLGFNYTDYVYFLLFQTHLPFSALEYLPQLSNFTSSIRGAVLDVRFVFLVILPVLLAARLLLLPWRWPVPVRPAWGWKAHALVLGGLLLVGLTANTASNSYVGKNPENALQFTPLQHFIATRGQLKTEPAVLTADVLARLNPPDPRYPLLHAQSFTGCQRPAAEFRELCAGARTAGSRLGRGPNIVFVMLESFRAQEIGVLGGQLGEGHAPATGTASLTPRFDGLARQGLLFRNFYGNGFQTRDGLVASYCGLVPNTGRPVLGAFGQVRQRCLSEILRERGYRTAWIHNGDAEFDGQRGFLQRNGFDKIIARWDFPLGSPTAGWGVTDEALMDQALETMRNLPEPFFAGILTITNHHPFEPPKGFSRPGSDRGVGPLNEYGRFLDTMAYTDRALGRLMDKVRAEPFFRNTVFLIYADHSVPQPAARPVQTVQDDLIWRHRIPLLIVADWLKAPAAIDAVGSQVDLPALAMDLLGDPASQSVPWIGRSPVPGGVALPALVIRPGNYVGVMNAAGTAFETRGTWQQVGTVSPAHRQWAEDLTLAERWALEQNRVVPGEPGTGIAQNPSPAR